MVDICIYSLARLFTCVSPPGLRVMSSAGSAMTNGDVGRRRLNSDSCLGLSLPGQLILSSSNKEGHAVLGSLWILRTNEYIRFTIFLYLVHGG